MDRPKYAQQIFVGANANLIMSGFIYVMLSHPEPTLFVKVLVIVLGAGLMAYTLYFYQVTSSNEKLESRGGE